MTDAADHNARQGAAAVEVKIDRLALDIPGLDRYDAEQLAREIGERLANAGVAGARPYVGVTVDGAGAGRAELAARIVASLMERLA